MAAQPPLGVIAWASTGKDTLVKMLDLREPWNWEIWGTGHAFQFAQRERFAFADVIKQELADELAQQLGYEGQRGVLVSKVAPDGPAAKVDDPPTRGDLIQEIERQEIKNMEDYRKAIAKIKDQKSVLVRLRRASEGRAWYVVIRKEE